MCADPPAKDLAGEHPQDIPGPCDEEAADLHRQVPLPTQVMHQRQGETGQGVQRQQDGQHGALLAGPLAQQRG